VLIGYSEIISESTLLCLR